MKINKIMLVVSLLIAALVGYGFYSANASEPYVLLLTIGSAISIFFTLGTLLSVGVKNDSRASVNMKIIATIFFIVLLVEHIIFAFTAVRTAPYIIITCILLLVYFIICYGIYKSQN